MSWLNLLPSVSCHFVWKWLLLSYFKFKQMDQIIRNLKEKKMCFNAIILGHFSFILKIDISSTRFHVWMKNVFITNFLLIFVILFTNCIYLNLHSHICQCQIVKCHQIGCHEGSQLGKLTKFFKIPIQN